MTFVAVWAYANYSTNLTLRAAVTLQYLGAMFRLLSIPSGWYWPILFGTILQACAAPFIINCHIIICNKWFSDKERNIAQSLLMISLVIGTGLAFALTSFYFSDVDSDAKSNLYSVLKA